MKETPQRTDPTKDPMKGDPMKGPYDGAGTTEPRFLTPKVTPAEC
jgi:hypothetical protein